MRKRHFYSDSRIAKYIEKVTSPNKPYALPWGEWDEWKEQEKKNNPIGYFINQTMADAIDNFLWFMIGWFFELTRYWYNVKHKSHYIDPKLKKGQYYDPDYLLERTMFEFIVDFVEIEAAYAGVNDNKNYVWVDGRCPEAGLDYLNTANAELQKVIEIYHFWKEYCNNKSIPGREEYDEYLEKLARKYDKSSIDVIMGNCVTYDERVKLNKLQDEISIKEKEIENKKTKYLHDIIDIRSNFWT